MIKKILFILSAIGFIVPVNAESVKISDIMRGLTTESCIVMMKAVEKKMFKGVPMRTYPIVNKSNPQGNIFSATAELDYNGDDSQVNITASPIKNGCNIVFTETFTSNNPCIEMREKLFKKWKMLGKLNQTLVFSYKKDKDFIAYLTPQGNGATCLITKRQIFYK
ncbi:MAG: hypothetical protein ACPG8V_03520 [Alphaproteobacteria bacterium]